MYLDYAAIMVAALPSTILIQPPMPGNYDSTNTAEDLHLSPYIPHVGVVACERLKITLRLACR